MRPRVATDSVDTFEVLKEKEIASLTRILEGFVRNPRQSEFHVSRIAQINRQILRLRRLDLARELSTCVQVAVAHTEDARLFVKDRRNRLYVNEVLTNKFKCRTDQQRVRALREFLLVATKLLDHPLGLDGAKVVFGLDPDQENHFAYTRSAFNNRTVFSAAMVRDALVAHDFGENVRHADSQFFLKAMIHEAVHRLNFIEKDRAVPSALRKLAQIVNEATDGPVERMGEVYEDDHPEAFGRLSLHEHLENADSYRSFIMGMSEAYRRLRDAHVDVETEEISVLQARVIHDGDTLWDIADDFYGDGRLWERLWEANKDTLRSGDPHKIYPGEMVLVPLD